MASITHVCDSSSPSQCGLGLCFSGKAFFPIEMVKYERVEMVGYGGYGDVYKGINCETNEAVFLKDLCFAEENEGLPSIFIRELSLLKEVAHRNIIRLLDIVISHESGTSLRLVYEKADLCLEQFIVTNPVLVKSRAYRKEIMLNLLSAIAYYHSRQIVHKELKPQNIRFNLNEQTWKVADFVWARAFGGICNRNVVLASYMAPELHISCEKYSTAADIWSAGCIFAELVIRRPLFPGNTTTQQLCSIFRIRGTPTEKMLPGINLSCPQLKRFSKCLPKKLDTVVPDLEPSGIDLLSKMLCMDPRKRITARDALRHPYFENH